MFSYMFSANPAAVDQAHQDSTKEGKSDGSHKLDKKHVVHEQHSSTTEHQVKGQVSETAKKVEDGDAVSVKQVV